MLNEIQFYFFVMFTMDLLYRINLHFLRHYVKLYDEEHDAWSLCVSQIVSGFFGIFASVPVALTFGTDHYLFMNSMLLTLVVLGIMTSLDVDVLSPNNFSTSSDFVKHENVELGTDVKISTDDKLIVESEDAKST